MAGRFPLVLPETPRWFINVTFMLVIVYGVMLGIEVIGWTGELLFVRISLVIGLIFILLINKMDFSNMKPILADGWWQPVKGLFPISGFPLAEYSYLMMLFPLVRPEDRKKLKRAMWISSAAIGLMGLFIAVMLLTVLGAELTMHSPFAVYDMEKQISVGDVLERVEISVAVIWISTIFSKMILCFYVVNVASAQLLRFSTYRPMVLPMASIVIPMSFIVFRNSAQLTNFASKVWPVFSVFQGLVLPLILLLVAAVRGISDNSVPKGGSR
ncbi:GerAB/ArcD/ProY family transporter [Paenibacillus solisilvae]|uniref:GerAB/ArcD/ProY family transporter n=1 Tax=Paenibacillus solisilvae TaxID=2486751 RepID=A0ABW0VPC8_9BACL